MVNRNLNAASKREVEDSLRLKATSPGTLGIWYQETEPEAAVVMRLRYSSEQLRWNKQQSHIKFLEPGESCTYVPSAQHRRHWDFEVPFENLSTHFTDLLPRHRFSNGFEGNLIWKALLGLVAKRWKWNNLSFWMKLWSYSVCYWLQRLQSVFFNKRSVCVILSQHEVAKQFFVKNLLNVSKIGTIFQCGVRHIEFYLKTMNAF